MAKDEKTSKRVASRAAKLLRDPNTPEDVKSVAASALTQAPDKSEEEKSARPKARTRRGSTKQRRRAASRC